MTPCPCGDPHPHTIATRRTFDNVRVDLDSDGTLWIGHQRSSTSGAAPVRTDAALDRARKVGRLVMDNACILSAAEVTDLAGPGRRVGATGCSGGSRTAPGSGTPLWRTRGLRFVGLRSFGRTWILVELST